METRNTAPRVPLVQIGAGNTVARYAFGENMIRSDRFDVYATWTNTYCMMNISLKCEVSFYRG